ncbi:antimicrobial peptide ABC transporter periplasmic binding protein SapA [Salinivirga cyanobacteriivorans]|uniref:Antimicrobial peptide ABC transporter periplasmic binding protein SapA n=1 Tax=Salinivirga cyanobacteriivorans TaxID=1307839 RepID=A0A0S2I0E4_9BACT|nr:ABC transporter substrate-binding protein [Salinivirga cyanobacteriivorans]ALO15827.1 antimicrobial peptide ABC transporter periplasmic binding protein SapA [Salinivirga cyanobacteriivorans]
MVRFSIILLLVFGFYTCKGPVEHQVKSNHLKFLESNYPGDIFPATINSLEESHLVTQIHDGLIGINPATNKQEGRLAKRWVVNNNHDKIIFHLHDNVYFHDDDCFESKEERLLSASDVKYSLEYTFWHKANSAQGIGLLKDIKGGSEYYDQCRDMEFEPGQLEGIKVKDSLTLIIYLNKSNPAFIYSMVSPDMAILPPEGLRKYGNECTIGCGPFVLDHFNPSTDSVAMFRNALYYKTDKNGKQLPYIDKLTAIFEATPAKSLRLIRDGKADFLLIMKQKYVSEFVEKNIDLFEGNDPELVLEQPKDMESTKIFMLRRSNVKNLHYSGMNFLYLDRVKIAE